MEVLLDGSLMESREAVHDLIGEKITLPPYYGRNLDALYDVLAAYPETVKITLVNGESLRAALGNYANALIRTLMDAARDNPKILFLLDNEKI